MKNVLLILVFLAPSICVSQSNLNWLRLYFRRADSVLLVIHDDTMGVLYVDSTGKHIPLPKLIIDGKPNYEIIKERHIISGKQLDTLITIFTRPLKSKVIETSMCFIPHHTVFLFKEGKLSFIDLCFWCRNFETSNDLNGMDRFDKHKWKELEDLFTKCGFNNLPPSIE